MTKRIKLAVYLPNGENCCPETGGALATWTRKVYGYLDSRLDTHVFATGFGKDCGGFHTHLVKTTSTIENFSEILRNRRCLGLLDYPKLLLSSHYARRAARRIRAIAPDIVHIHNDPCAVAVIRKSLPSARLILHMNNDHLIEGPAEGKLAEQAVTASSAVAFCSSYCRDAAHQKVKALGNRETLLLHNGTSPVSSSILHQRSLACIRDCFVLLFVGRIVPQKGLHTLLDAMPIVLDSFPKTRLRVVGGVNFGSKKTSPYLEQIKAHIAPIRQSVELLGPMSHDNVQREFLSSDIFVCPSQWNDPFPLVNLEAMGSGTPVIAFARGGIPEALGDAGMLLDRYDPKSLGDSIVQLLMNESRRYQMTHRGYSRVAKHFTWPKIAEDWYCHLTNRLP